LPQQIYDAGVLELKDVIAPSALKITPRSLNLGEKVVRSFFVISYPRYLSDSWFSPIINLDQVFDISIFVHPIETAKILRHFQKKVAEVQSQIHTREEKGMVRDPLLDTAYQDLELYEINYNKPKKEFLMLVYIFLFMLTQKKN
jgi:conjugal transfer ATP-binding protein TraC